MRSQTDELQTSRLLSHRQLPSQRVPTPQILRVGRGPRSRLHWRKPVRRPVAEAATTLPLAVAWHGGGRGRRQEEVAQSQSPEMPKLLTCRPPGPSAAAGGPGTVLTLNTQEEACSGSGREGAGVRPARSGAPVPPVEGGPSPSQPLTQPAGGSSRAEDTPKGDQSCRPSTDQSCRPSTDQTRRASAIHPRQHLAKQGSSLLDTHTGK